MKAATETLRNASMEISSSTTAEVKAYTSLLVEHARVPGTKQEPSLFADLARALLADRVLPHLSQVIRTWKVRDLTSDTKETAAELVELYASDPLPSSLKLDQQRKTIRTFLELCLTKDDARDTFGTKSTLGLALLESGSTDLVVHYTLIDTVPRIHVKLTRTLKLDSRARELSIEPFAERTKDCFDFAHHVLREAPDQQKLVSTFLLLVALSRPVMVASTTHHQFAGNS